MSVAESPLLWVSLVWILIAVVGSILVRWTDDPALYRLAIWTGAFCLWLMWLLVWLSQINPLVAPQVAPPKQNPPPPTTTKTAGTPPPRTEF